MRTSIGQWPCEYPTQIAQFGATPGGHCANQVADHNGGYSRG
jgi:hypothetical protein